MSPLKNLVLTAPSIKVILDNEVLEVAPQDLLNAILIWRSVAESVPEVRVVRNNWIRSAPVLGYCADGKIRVVTYLIPDDPVLDVPPEWRTLENTQNDGWFVDVLKWMPLPEVDA